MKTFSNSKEGELYDLRSALIIELWRFKKGPHFGCDLQPKEALFSVGIHHRESL